MHRVQLPSAQYTGESPNWYHLASVRFDFWNRFAGSDMCVQSVNVDTRCDHMHTGEQLRDILQHMFGHTVHVNHLNEEMFCVTAGDHMLITVRNANHRSHMKNRINEYRIQVHGAAHQVQHVIQQIEQHLLTQKLVKVSWFYQSGHGLDSTNLHIESNPQPLRDEFYPWFPEGVDEFVRKFMQHSATVLVLYGPPGTGKTSFLRHLLQSTQSNAMITYDDRVIQNDGFFVDYLTDDEHDVMIVEDADVLLAPREDGANHIMSKFLNVSDGLIRVPHKKMVFTTNITQLNRIDQALLRPGRCFAAVNFRELTPSEAAHAAIAAQVPERDWYSQNSWSLAQLWGDQDQITGVPQHKFKVGFV